MVSAVFHTPRTPATASAVNVAIPTPTEPAPSPARPAPKPGVDWKELWLKVLPPFAGIGLLIGIWALLTIKSTTFPTPFETFQETVKVFSDPF